VSHVDVHKWCPSTPLLVHCARCWAESKQGQNKLRIKIKRNIVFSMIVSTTIVSRRVIISSSNNHEHLEVVIVHDNKVLMRCFGCLQYRPEDACDSLCVYLHHNHHHERRLPPLTMCEVPHSGKSDTFHAAEQTATSTSRLSTN
jgi:hypothetical protein